jgi:hypothetical protein
VRLVWVRGFLGCRNGFLGVGEPGWLPWRGCEWRESQNGVYVWITMMVSGPEVGVGVGVVRSHLQRTKGLEDASAMSAERTKAYTGWMLRCARASVSRFGVKWVYRTEGCN